MCIRDSCQTSAQKYIVHENPAWREVPGTTDIISTGSGDGKLAVMLEDEMLGLVLKTSAKTEIVAVWDGNGDSQGRTMLEGVNDVTAGYVQDAVTIANG